MDRYLYTNIFDIHQRKQKNMIMKKHNLDIKKELTHTHQLNILYTLYKSNTITVMS